MMHKDHSRAISRAAAKGTFILIAKLPPLKTHKQPAVAAIAGFCFGGLGLGLYFLSWIDFVLPVVIWVAVIIISVPTAGALILLSPFFCAIYGYQRAKISNAKLDDDYQAPVSFSKSPPSIPPLRPMQDIILPSTQDAGSPEGRLERLSQLRQRGLISDREHDEKKMEILSKL